MNGLVAGVLLAAAPIPAHVVHHEFQTTSVNKLVVIETRGETAVVEGEQGEMALIHLTDRIGLEAVTVEGIGHGCLLLTGDGGRFSVCAEAPATPRS